MPALAARIEDYHRPLAALDPNRADALGAALSAILPLAAVIVANGIAELAGATPLAAVQSGTPFGMPGWAAAAVWLMIYPMWGMARWMAWQMGRPGRKASRWVVGLMVAGIAYPFAVPYLSGLGLAAADFALLLVAFAALSRVAAVSKGAALWLAPSFLWLGVTGLFGFTTVAQGWTPPFALTNQGSAA